MTNLSPEPPLGCELCPRLADFRQENRTSFSDWFNGPVPSFGPEDARFLIVGLAPGLQGANRTGRPFTGDHAGDLLYDTLLKFDFASGTYMAVADDGLMLKNCMITNAVRCVPPKNKPIGSEIRQCRQFLRNRILVLKNLEVILALGRIAHESTVSVFNHKKVDFPFKHSAQHQLTDSIKLFDSYHCSRYNTNTGRLTEAMFHDVFRKIRNYLG